VNLREYCQGRRKPAAAFTSSPFSAKRATLVLMVSAQHGQELFDVIARLSVPPL
jgi:hypothetical protein